MKFLSLKGASIVALALLATGSTLPNSNRMLCVFAPENTMHIPVGANKDGSGLDEATYNSAVDKVENYYKPIVAAAGGVLTINRMWTDDTVNSQARRTGKNWYIDAFGGLARYNIMTYDAEVAVLCHEMGHHLGGFPKFSSLFGMGSSWAAVEGQADYFATSKCFRRVFANDDNATAMTGVQIPQEVNAGCSRTFKSQTEIALCQREAMAGKLLADILWNLGRGNTAAAAPKDGGGEPAVAPSFSTPSTDVVSKTNEQHPLAQCRLDTYFNGSICFVAATEDFGQKDGITGACAQEKGDAYGYRPNCWYKPGKSQ
jgi:hypothetical protein